ncbi:MAG: SBBP repeat-containing protein [candidate division Zixibacteria bacterium]|nr:SBBP repeat-containing protein [candidate division Zixibacteria bacterium]
MYKLLLVFFITFIVSLPLFAQSVDTAWVRTYAGPAGGDDGAGPIATDIYGNIYVAGISYDSWTNYDYTTIKYKSNGDTVWIRKYNGPGNSADWVSGIAVDNLSNVYVTGYNYGGGAYGYYATIKYNSNGSTAWVRSYDGPENFETGSDIVVDKSHNVYVTGFSYSSETQDDYATIKYNSNGDTLWVRKYNGPGNSMDGAYAIAIDSSGNVYVTGYSWSGVTMGDYATIKYYSNGDTAWVRRYDGSANNQDYACDIAVDNSDNVYVTGYGYGSSGFSEYVTIKYYSNGDTAWVRRYKNGESDLARANVLAVDSSGNVYVSGYSYGSGTSFDYATIKYNSNGDTVWVRRYNGPGNAFDNPFAITLDGSGNVYVTGYSDDGTGSYQTDWATIKYNSKGDSIWIRTYNGPANGNDAASSIVIDDSDNVYVTGGSEGSGGYSDFCTIKYVQFLRGDADKDGSVSLSDIVYLINDLFKFGPAPDPIQSGDTNCDGDVSLSDIVYLISNLLKGGPPPCI